MTNKKLFAILGVVALLLTLGFGCGKKEEGTTGPGAPTENKEQGGGIFSSIRDAFDRSLSIRCEYTDEDGNSSVNYIKNKMIRTESVMANQGSAKFFGLFRDDKMYVWDDQSGNGMIFNISGMKTEPTTMGETEVRSTADIISELEKEKDKCRAESVPDSYFEVPSNVNFQDFNFPNVPNQ